MSKNRGPRFIQYIPPVLDALRDLGGSSTPRKVYDWISTRYDIPDEEMTQHTTNGQLRYENMVGWARFYLVKAGMIDTQKRGIWTLTTEGQDTKLTENDAYTLFRGVQEKYRGEQGSNSDDQTPLHFYHVRIGETMRKAYFEYDLSLEEVKGYIYQYLKTGCLWIGALQFTKPRFKIVKTQRPADDMAERPYRKERLVNKNQVFVMSLANQLQDRLFKEVHDEIAAEDQANVQRHIEWQKQINSRKIFIVHGHDELLLTQVENFLRRLELDPIILKDQANTGLTIIEKIEKHSDVSFGIVLYTPCDEGQKKGTNNLRARARQNVVLEHGYLMGKLGRRKVAALVSDSLELPNDISGVVYIAMNDWKMDLLKELRAAGLEIDANKVIGF